MPTEQKKYFNIFYINSFVICYEKKYNLAYFPKLQKFMIEEYKSHIKFSSKTSEEIRHQSAVL